MVREKGELLSGTVKQSITGNADQPSIEMINQPQYSQTRQFDTSIKISTLQAACL
jgi:hypothetical protein